MQSLWLLPTSLVLLASPAVQPGESPPGWHAVLERYASLDPASQQQWARDLFSRLDRASRIVLGPEQLAGQRARHDHLLRQIARGRSISHAELRQLLRQTDEREKAAIERLARRFRIRVYDTFRQERDVFARRGAAWNHVLSSWEAAGGRFEQQGTLIDWLQAAIRSSTPGAVGPLPPVPDFEMLAAGPRSLVVQRPSGGIESPTPRRTDREPIRPPQSVAGLPKRSPPDAALPRSARPSPAATPAPQPSPRDVVAPVPVVEPRRASGALPRIAEPPVSSVPPPDRPATGLPASGAARRSATVDASTAGANAARQPPLKTPRASVIPLPNLHDALPEAEQLADHPPRQLPTTGQALDPASDQPPPRVNLDDLAARIAGTNLALRALEAELDEDRHWNARRLGPLVDRLGILVLRRDDLAKFRGLISPKEQARVGRLASPQGAISLLAARIFEARSRAAGPDFIGTEAQRRAELRELDALSRLLAHIASDRPPRSRPPARRRG